MKFEWILMKINFNKKKEKAALIYLLNNNESMSLETRLKGHALLLYLFIFHPNPISDQIQF